jgi:polyribonucleotide nucleotidyltransferase
MKRRSELSSERVEKTIKAIASQSGAEVNIADDGTVTIYGRNNASAQLAKELVKSIVEDRKSAAFMKGQ